MLGLVLTGVSVFPVVTLVEWLVTWLAQRSPDFAVTLWLQGVNAALSYNAEHYPFLLYTLDWLGFAHLLIALVFWGAWRDPVQNRWVIEFGILACSLTFPAIILFGLKNDLPLWWLGLDSLFGIVGALLLLRAHQLTIKLATHYKEGHAG